VAVLKSGKATISIKTADGQLIIRFRKELLRMPQDFRELVGNLEKVLDKQVERAANVWYRNSIKAIRPIRYHFGLLEKSFFVGHSLSYIGGAHITLQVGFREVTIPNVFGQPVTNKQPAEYFKYVERGAFFYPIMKGDWYPAEGGYGTQRFFPGTGRFYIRQRPTPAKKFIFFGKTYAKSSITHALQAHLRKVSPSMIFEGVVARFAYEYPKYVASAFDRTYISLISR